MHSQADLHRSSSMDIRLASGLPPMHLERTVCTNIMDMVVFPVRTARSRSVHRPLPCSVSTSPAQSPCLSLRVRLTVGAGCTQRLTRYDNRYTTQSRSYRYIAWVWMTSDRFDAFATTYRSGSTRLRMHARTNSLHTLSMDNRRATELIPLHSVRTV